MREKRSFFNNLFTSKKSANCCKDQGKEEDGAGYSCNDENCNIGEENISSVEGEMSIKILGSGCKNCKDLVENTKFALSQMGIQANIEKITDLSAITEYGVMSTPVLVINEKIVSYGKVLKPKEIIKIFEKQRE